MSYGSVYGLLGWSFLLALTVDVSAVDLVWLQMSMLGLLWLARRAIDRWGRREEK